MLECLGLNLSFSTYCMSLHNSFTFWYLSLFVLHRGFMSTSYKCYGDVEGLGQSMAHTLNIFINYYIIVSNCSLYICVTQEEWAIASSALDTLLAWDFQRNNSFKPFEFPVWDHFPILPQSRELWVRWSHKRATLTWQDHTSYWTSGVNSSLVAPCNFQLNTLPSSSSEGDSQFSIIMIGITLTLIFFPSLLTL